jgi:hypothetical protein
MEGIDLSGEEKELIVHALTEYAIRQGKLLEDCDVKECETWHEQEITKAANLSVKIKESRLKFKKVNGVN